MRAVAGAAWFFTCDGIGRCLADGRSLQGGVGSLREASGAATGCKLLARKFLLHVHVSIHRDMVSAEDEAQATALSGAQRETVHREAVEKEDARARRAYEDYARHQWFSSACVGHRSI